MNEAHDQPAARWFLVTPLPQGAEVEQLLREHPRAWVLDTATGQMFSPMGWPTGTAHAAA